MNAGTRTLLIDGPAGAIDVALDTPAVAPTGVAVVAHPHPLYGGTRDNKVAQTLARALRDLGYLCWRPNFRGVGQSAGRFDEGIGETDDLLAVVDHALAHAASAGLAQPRLVLAGFSFGSFVQVRVAARLRERGRPAHRLVLVGTAAARFDVEAVPPDTLVVHGENDETVPLKDVFDWARPQDLPVVVLPGADHFFHRKLTLLKRVVLEAFGAAGAQPPPGSDRPAPPA
ncbi:MAG: alpha/beta hydrolase [Burkholderiales bacterium]|nr:alpha/beta hydrolase [Burkholderiales bacterium]OJX06232.1 MAG: alpha/beta hydrolase [Burkholderiales bacterium 70-64]